MVINLEDWMMGFGGGLLIGAASALFLWGTGRIAGISGVLGGLITRDMSALSGERVMFLIGLAVAPLIWTTSFGVPDLTMPGGGPIVLIAAGLLVGFGTQMGSGCTSGHGVCGLSRFSTRSFVGVATFILIGVVTVMLGRHVFGAL
ncbi:MAG: YeeE/YedE family protein [Pseudomonadota bacterium]